MPSPRRRRKARALLLPVGRVRDASYRVDILDLTVIGAKAVCIVQHSSVTADASATIAPDGEPVAKQARRSTFVTFRCDMWVRTGRWWRLRAHESWSRPTEPPRG
jgi:hypothetical protein